MVASAQMRGWIQDPGGRALGQVNLLWLEVFKVHTQPLSRPAQRQRGFLYTCVFRPQLRLPEGPPHKYTSWRVGTAAESFLALGSKRRCVLSGSALPSIKSHMGTGSPGQGQHLGPSETIVSLTDVTMPNPLPTKVKS